ncbi:MULTISPECIES: GTP 3',8-cyclase MoaA [Bacillaceae]|uniref:GTP 3',8-cyclase n=1 Tax=Oceanobacillus caeni TaxID=405946 RepID=A0ABR5MJQ4_9BACI|nr:MULTISPECIES: GTP 3',8-cyclase MoaA [Bacillaceae]KKE78179.1 molybdenum cofactor biosynthesis protein A [Bacilli bacterium VT-13-104]PZD84752.1 GTP 3',8-cyclase MoaA [Bacilli bacterium]KPH75812.1 molybdenum cofactor biosynthesis protein A [Oceanobacillus caeni]MBU8791965.1 GTP 3',8-cyclase MoaA [Oceanobacillus caeni]MED4473705.1 GTP 3',8-cyclase MoaA [Oceanobacillus caeni]
MSVITDKFGRPLKDLRISVIDRCNFRCTYCMPKEIFGRDFVFMPREQLLSFEEIERLAKIFVDLGVRKIRLTGGEPLMRRDLPTLISKLTKIDQLEDIGLTTNGSLLGHLAEKLKEAGLKRVNVSLDALDDELFKSINDSGVGPERVLKGIQKAKEVGLEVKVNMVVKKGMNDHQVVPMAAYFKEQGIILRYIEFMDVGQTNSWDFSKVITKKQIYEQLNEQFDLEPVDPDYLGEVAKRYRYVGTNTEVGFITSVSESFCSTCTRARIAADGKMYTCLFAENGFDFRELLRSDKSDLEIKDEVIRIWNNRTDRYSDERTEESAKSRSKIEMSYIGG